MNLNKTALHSAVGGGCNAQNKTVCWSFREARGKPEGRPGGQGRGKEARGGPLAVLRSPGGPPDLPSGSALAPLEVPIAGDVVGGRNTPLCLVHSVFPWPVMVSNLLLSVGKNAVAHSSCPF